MKLPARPPAIIRACSEKCGSGTSPRKSSNTPRDWKRPNTLSSAAGDSAMMPTCFSFGGVQQTRASATRLAIPNKRVYKMDAHADWVMGTRVLGRHEAHDHDQPRSIGKLSIVGAGQFVGNITSITPGTQERGPVGPCMASERMSCSIGGSDGEPKLYKMIRTQARQIGDDFNKLKGYPGIGGSGLSGSISTPTAASSSPGSRHRGHFPA